MAKINNKISMRELFEQAEAFTLSEKFNEKGYTYLKMGEGLKARCAAGESFYIVDLDTNCKYKEDNVLCVAYKFANEPDATYYSMVSEKSRALYDQLIRMVDYLEIDPLTTFRIEEVRTQEDKSRKYNKLVIAG